MKKKIITGLLLSTFALGAMAEEMDKMWGEQTVKLRAQDAKRGQLFTDGNYAMFIHWGIFSLLANQVDGKTYYGIGEWLMSRAMANIPVEQYKTFAKDFNPVHFDARSIARLAKAAGMKYIIITAKHHEGFAMYDSKACDFNIVKATPWKKDPMKELAIACRAEGLGFGFYYSHNQDWTFPGGNGGPKTDAKGNPASFEDYFEKKCLPQVQELTTQYGPLTLIWFDTPGRMPEEEVKKLIQVVRKNQPNALVSGRVGHGLGDYRTLGDMEIPHKNVEGLWESVDTSNDSWGYAWYDQNWKTPKEVLKRLVSCVARGGTYMLNIGLKGDGSIPEHTIRMLTESGEWVHRYPQVVYATEASPWQHALPWGDVTRKGNRLFLTVFEWPTSGRLYLPGLQTPIKTARLLKGSRSMKLSSDREHGWTYLSLPAKAPEKLASVIELDFATSPKVDQKLGVDPELGTDLFVDFATTKNAEKGHTRWMEKFGEWKHTWRVFRWKDGGKASWEITVLEPGDYQASLVYSGKGRLVWGIDVEGGEHIQNQQAATEKYAEYPIGWIHFPKPGTYTISVSCLDGDRENASLKALKLRPVL